jgi:hypothetical protein
MKTNNPHSIRNFRDLKRAKQKIRGQQKATKAIISENWRTSIQLARQQWYLTGNWTGIVMQGLRLGKAYFTHRITPPDGKQRASGNNVPSWLQSILAGLDIAAMIDGYRQQAKNRSEE